MLSLLSEVDRSLLFRSPAPRDWSIRIQYLGTAGFILSSRERTLVIDPYVSRPSVWQSLSGPLIPDKRRIRSYIPHADDVMVGHAHHDHVLDAPDLCHQTGARLIGSRSVCNVGRAAGLPESQLVETTGQEDIPSGPDLIRGIPSYHGTIFGRVPLPGSIEQPPPWPARIAQLRHGLVLNWYVEMAGIRLVHIDSAAIIESELRGLRADVLCLCAVGRKHEPDYVRTAIQELQPRYVIPCHWDLFTTPIEAPPKLLPGVRLEELICEIQQLGSTPILLPFFGELGVCAKAH